VATVDQEGNVTGVGAGTATIIVTTTQGGLTDECAVTVIPVVAITTQPEATVSIPQGGAKDLTVAATATLGAELSYQWYSNTAKSNEGGEAVAGATGATFAIPTATTGQFYYFCEVGAAGNAAAVRSATAEVSVIDPTTYDEGVVINGVKWATRNVEKKGHFADTPESFGLMYQWQRDVSWSMDDPLKAWDAEGNEIANPTWNATGFPDYYPWTSLTDPCPDGWKVPTTSSWYNMTGGEYGAVSREWVAATDTSPSGMRIIDDNTGNSIFLPATPRRASNGARSSSATIATYAVEYRGYAMLDNSPKITVSSSSTNVSMGAYGMPVRCVAGEKYVRN
jgi:uncharacterized protein (TIGR02145 family)